MTSVCRAQVQVCKPVACGNATVLNSMPREAETGSHKHTECSPLHLVAHADPQP